MLFLAPSLIGLWIYQLNNCKSKIYAIFWVFKVFRIIYTKEFDEVGGHVEERATFSVAYFPLLLFLFPSLSLHATYFLFLKFAFVSAWCLGTSNPSNCCSYTAKRYTYTLNKIDLIFLWMQWYV